MKVQYATIAAIGLIVASTSASAQYGRYQLPPQASISPYAGATSMYPPGIQIYPSYPRQIHSPQPNVQPNYAPSRNIYIPINNNGWAISPNAGATPLYYYK